MGDINLLKSPSGASDYNVTDEFTAPAGEIMTFFFSWSPLGKVEAAMHFFIYTLYR